MKSGGGSFGRLSVQVGADWSTYLSTYPDHSPILDIDAGSTSVSLCLTGGPVGKSAVEFARELADRVAKFAAEVERLHAGTYGTTGDASGGGTGAGEAA